MLEEKVCSDLHGKYCTHSLRCSLFEASYQERQHHLGLAIENYSKN